MCITSSLIYKEDKKCIENDYNTYIVVIFCDLCMNAGAAATLKYKSSIIFIQHSAYTFISSDFFPYRLDFFFFHILQILILNIDKIIKRSILHFIPPWHLLSAQYLLLDISGAGIGELLQLHIDLDLDGISVQRIHVSSVGSLTRAEKTLCGFQASYLWIY